jgi:hypothetical protein
VHVSTIGAGWRAGQHVRLRVVSNAWFGWWATWLVCRARPFTIAAGSDTSGMMLPVKAQGSWTRNLLRMSGDAADARPKEKITDTERGRTPAREVRVIVEGPYSKYQVSTACDSADTVLPSRRSWLHSLHGLFGGCPRRWWQWHFICHERP